MEIRFYGNYDLMDEAVAFNWYNTDFDMESESQAAELAAANELYDEMVIEGDSEANSQKKEEIWTMLCK